jgi:hypothetical protein
MTVARKPRYVATSDTFGRDVARDTWTGEDRPCNDFVAAHALAQLMNDEHDKTRAASQGAALRILSTHFGVIADKPAEPRT